MEICEQFLQLQQKNIWLTFLCTWYTSSIVSNKLYDNLTAWVATLITAVHNHELSTNIHTFRQKIPVTCSWLINYILFTIITSVLWCGWLTGRASGILACKKYNGSNPLMFLDNHRRSRPRLR